MAPTKTPSPEPRFGPPRSAALQFARLAALAVLLSCRSTTAGVERGTPAPGISDAIPTGAVAGAPKRGFNSPLASLLRTSLRDKAEQVFVRNADVFDPFFSAEGVGALWREHADLRADHAYALWPLLIFGSWRPRL